MQTYEKSDIHTICAVSTGLLPFFCFYFCSWEEKQNDCLKSHALKGFAAAAMSPGVFAREEETHRMRVLFDLRTYESFKRCE